MNRGASFHLKFTNPPDWSVRVEEDNNVVYFYNYTIDQTFSIPYGEFCLLVGHFMTGTDLKKNERGYINDPRLSLLSELRTLRIKDGGNGPQSLRLEREDEL